MQYDFESCPDRRGTECSKWNAYAEDVLPMWVADMDFLSPPEVVAALQTRVAHGVFGYPRYTSELRQLIVNWVEDRHNWQIQPEEILFLPGVVTGFNLACQLFADQPASVLVQPPLYPPMLAAPANAGLRRQEARMRQGSDGRYQVDWQEFKGRPDLTTRLFLLCNPHNPTGRVFSRSELERMAEFCLQREILICSDEIHNDLVYSESQHIPIAALDPEIARHTITLIAPSKTFNIAGLQFSAAIIPDPELRRRYLAADQGLAGSINLMGITAAEAAYRSGHAWLDQLLQVLEANRDYLAGFVREHLPGIQMSIPEGTYLAWLDCRGVTFPTSPYKYFLKEARVALSDGRVFGSGGEGFVRLNFGCPSANLVQALERMAAALERLPEVDSAAEKA